MPLGFYGFDFGGYPTTSRLFNPQVMNKARDAYNTGFNQFVQYDPNQEQVQEEAPQAQSQRSLASLFGDNRFVALGGNNYVTKDGEGYTVRPAPRHRSMQPLTAVQVDEQGNLAGGMKLSDLKPTQLDAYYKMLALLNQGGM